MAKSSILQIIIQMAKTGNADKETVKSLASLKMNIGQAMSAFAAFAGVAYTVDKALDATVGTFVSYAAQVRELNRLTGASSEETSRIIQLADDMTISYESLQKSLWFASKNGVEVNVESLARLADEYVALAGPTEQAAFLAEKFGKSGGEMAKMLEQGGDAVREMSSAIQGSLILTDQAVQEARQYEMAMDDLNDTVQALKVSIGTDLVQGFNDFIDYGKQHVELMKETSEATGETYTRGLHYAAMLQESKLAQMQAADAVAAHGEALDGLNPAIEQNTQLMLEQGVATEEMSQKNTDMLSLIMNMQGENDRYNESLTTLTDKMAALRAEQEGYLEGSTKYNEIQAEMDETGAAIEQLAADHEAAGKRIAFSLLQQKLAVDGLSDAEFESLLAIGQQWGVIDETTAKSAQSMQTQVNQLSERLSKARHETNMLHNQWGKFHEKTGEVTELFVNINVSGSLPGGFGGGGAGGGGAGGANPHGSGAGVQMMAEGGQLGRGWTMVGERGFELVSPTGWVFPNAESQALIASGLIPENGMLSGGPMQWSEPADPVPQIPYVPAGGGGGGSTSTRRRRSRNDGEVAPPSSGAATTLAVAEAVAPMAETTATAVESAAQAQQVTVAMVNELKAAQDASNEIMQGIRDDLKHNSATVKNSFLAGIEQMRG